MAKMTVRFKEGTAQPPRRQENNFAAQEETLSIVESVVAEPIYIDRVVEMPIEVIKEVPVEIIKYIEVPVEVEKQVEVIKEVPVEVIKEVEKIIEVEKRVHIDRPIYIDRIVFKEKTPHVVLLGFVAETLLLVTLLVSRILN